MKMTWLLAVFFLVARASVQAQPVTVCPKDYCNPALQQICADKVPYYESYEPAGSCIYSPITTVPPLPPVNVILRVVRELSTGKLCTCSGAPLANKAKKCIDSLKACTNTKACSQKYTKQGESRIFGGEKYTWVTTCRSVGKDALVLKLEMESTNANLDYCYCPKGKDTATPVPWHIAGFKAPMIISDKTNKCPSRTCEPFLYSTCANKDKSDPYAPYTGTCKAYGQTHNVLTYINKAGKPQCVCARDNKWNGVPPVPTTTCPQITCKGAGSSIQERYGCCDRHLFMGNKYCTTPTPLTFSLYSLCNDSKGKKHKVLRLLALPDGSSSTYNYCTCP